MTDATMADHPVTGRFFQLGYVVRELDAAITAYGRRCGQTRFSIIPAQSPDGSPSPITRMGLAYVDEIMIELIEVDPGQSSIYSHALPERADGICLHHLGYLVDDFAQIMAALAHQGYPVTLSGQHPEFLSYVYADTRPEFGLYSEYVCLHAGGYQLFDAVPRVRRG